MVKGIKKKHGKETELEQFSETLEADNDNHYWEETIHEKNINAVMAALEEMNEDCQAVLKYFHIEKKKMIEIAQLMGFANADVAKNQKSRCLKYLRKMVLPNLLREVA